MKFEIDTLEGQIALAIYTACSSKEGLDAFCAKSGFTENDFREFLEFGVNAMKAFRVMDEYYTNQEGE
jgi:hypothetical protein